MSMNRPRGRCPSSKVIVSSCSEVLMDAHPLLASQAAEELAIKVAGGHLMEDDLFWKCLRAHFFESDLTLALQIIAKASCASADVAPGGMFSQSIEEAEIDRRNVKCGAEDTMEEGLPALLTVRQHHVEVPSKVLQLDIIGAPAERRPELEEIGGNMQGLAEVVRPWCCTVHEETEGDKVINDLEGVITEKQREVEALQASLKSGSLDLKAGGEADETQGGSSSSSSLPMDAPDADRVEELSDKAYARYHWQLYTSTDAESGTRPRDQRALREQFQQERRALQAQNQIQKPNKTKKARWNNYYGSYDGHGSYGGYGRYGHVGYGCYGNCYCY
ncbi:unnamed protein product [Symbiodinium natans]|uniref:Uncharacterized protein n=1 Tax=Symbiodinium natans TaxID=878477 RepID=A0A812N2J4_9DINO|nr:unnamed protein product [Symbiodinium natans]